MTKKVSTVKAPKHVKTGVTKDVKKQAESLHQNELIARDELSSISHENKKELRDDNGRYHLRPIQRTFYGEK